MSRFSRLIAAGYADYQLLANNANQIVTYTIGLTQKGVDLANAWLDGNRERVVGILGPEPGDDGGSQLS